MSHKPNGPSPTADELENELRLVEHTIAHPTASHRNSSGALEQASWLLTALGRLDPALAAAELAQTCWGIAKDASGSGYGGGVFWSAHRAAAVAHMSNQNWREAREFLLNVLRDFGEEDKAFYLSELCRQALGTRSPNPIWNILKEPDRELAEFDAQAYALQAYRDQVRFLRPYALQLYRDQPTIDPGDTSLVRWRGVPIPPELTDVNWTARRIDVEPNPTVRACAIVVFGPDRYARESELPAEQRQLATNPSPQARAYAWRMSIPRALGKPDRR